MPSVADIIQQRLSKAREQMQEQGIDVLLIQNPVSSFYFSLFSCSNSCIIISKQSVLFLTDFRYMTSAQSLKPYFDVYQMTQNAYNEIGDWCKKLNAKVIGFEETIPYTNFLSLKKALRSQKMIPAASIVRNLRMIKDEAEIKLLATNQKLNEKICAKAFKNVTNYKTELDLQRFVRTEFINNNSEEAFETIVAGGTNSALPHARPTKSAVKTNRLLLIDMGLKKNAYCSDLTRTSWFGNGKKTGGAFTRAKEIYEVVLEAQLAALKTIKAGVPAAEVDKAARDVITAAGYGNYFGHGLGHGVGLEIHEGPTLNPRSNDILTDGMVVTVEPGIYLPDLGGVRIEDLVVVTQTGYRNLTSIPKKWSEIEL